MYLGMAIGAGRAQDCLSRTQGRNVVATVEKTRMIGLGMTTLAQEWLSYRQHPLLGRAMGIVTGRAVLACRLVFPEERPALLAMACGAGFHHRVAYEHAYRVGTVGIMAVIARHQPLLHGMMAATAELGALFEVAGQAQAGVMQLIAHGFLVCVDCVATDTGKIRRLVYTGRPVHGPAGLVAVQAYPVLGVDITGRKQGAALEYHAWWLQSTDVVRACSVAALTGLVRKRRTDDRTVAMGSLEYGCHPGIIVADQAGTGTLGGVTGILL